MSEARCVDGAGWWTKFADWSFTNIYCGSYEESHKLLGYDDVFGPHESEEKADRWARQELERMQQGWLGLTSPSTQFNAGG